jgi:hypothetical protein
LTSQLTVALLYLSPQGGEIGEGKMSKQELRYKGYTAVKEGMSGWYQWVIYAPKDQGICGGVRELEGEQAGLFAVEFFRNGRIIGVDVPSIEEGIDWRIAK